MSTPPHAPPHVPSAAADKPIAQSNADPGSGAPSKLAALVAVQAETRSLLTLWLAEQQWEAGDLDRLRRAPDVIIVEVSFPRTAAPAELARLVDDFPAVPVVMVSPTVVAGTPSRGDAARLLGVAAVLGIPLNRTDLLETIRQLTTRS